MQLQMSYGSDVIICLDDCTHVDAPFAEQSSMVYALSFRTGEYRGHPGERADRDIPNTEEPLANVVYCIDDVKTSSP